MPLARAGKVSECRQYLGRAQRLGDQTGSLLFAYVSEAEFGRALALNGHREEAINWLRASRAFFTEKQNSRAAVFAGLALGEALAPQDVPSAREELRSTLVTAHRYDMPGWSAQALLLLSELDAAAADRPELLAEAQQLSQDLGWRKLAQRINNATTAI